VTSGSTIKGSASSDRPASFGLDATIMATVPISITTLRSAIEAVDEKADLIWVVSAVRRESTSPERCVSKKPGLRLSRWLKMASRMSATTRSPIHITK